MKKILNLIAQKFTFRVCIITSSVLVIFVIPPVLFFMIKYDKINLHELVAIIKNSHDVGYFIFAGVILGIIPIFTAFKNSSYQVLFGYNKLTPIIFLSLFLVTFSLCIAGVFIKLEYAMYGSMVFIASNATSWLTFWVIRRAQIKKIKSFPEDEWLMRSSGEKVF